MKPLNFNFWSLRRYFPFFLLDFLFTLWFTIRNKIKLIDFWRVFFLSDVFSQLITKMEHTNCYYLVKIRYWTLITYTVAITFTGFLVHQLDFQLVFWLKFTIFPWKKWKKTLQTKWRQSEAFTNCVLMHCGNMKYHPTNAKLYGAKCIPKSMVD